MEREILREIHFVGFNFICEQISANVQCWPEKENVFLANNIVGVPFRLCGYGLLAVFNPYLARSNADLGNLHTKNTR